LRGDTTKVDTDEFDPANPPPMRLRWVARQLRLSLLLIGLAEAVVLVSILPTAVRGDWWVGVWLVIWTGTLVHAVFDT